jgi:IPT/TIG domain
MRPIRKALCCLAASAILSVGCIKSSTIIPHTPPAIGALSPGHGPDSTLVTISGAAFSDTLANNAVFFNGKQAVVVSASDTALVAMVPTLAGTGSVTVTVDGSSTTAGVFTYDTTWRVSMVADNLQTPFYLSVDASGNIYVPTYNNGVINKIDAQGNVTPFFNQYAWGTALDTAGNLYTVADFGDSGHIYKYSPSGTQTFVVADSGTIWSIALDAAGNIYASNASTNTIDKITPQGVITKLGGSLYYVSGVAVASDGTIYAANYTTPAYDNANGVVSKITPDGTVSVVTNAPYDGQSGIAIDANNNVFVTSFDQEYAVGGVVRITPAGVAKPLISSTILNFPCGIAVDNTGHLYVAQQEDAVGASVGSVVKLTFH